MVLDAAQALGIVLTRSWMIGDRWRDVECGQKAGLRTVFIDFGYSDEVKSSPEFHGPVIFRGGFRGPGCHRGDAELPNLLARFGTVTSIRGKENP